MLFRFINVFLILKISISTIIFYLVYILIKHAVMRQNYSKIIPSFKVRFLDILGNAHYFPYSYRRNAWNGYKSTTYMLQYSNIFFHLFRKESLFCGWIGYSPFICLISPDAVEEMLTGKREIEKAFMYKWLDPWLGSGLVTSSGTKWKTRRKLLTPAFHFDILRDFQPTINEKSQQMVKLLKQETTKEFTRILTFLTYCSLDITCETTFGVDMQTQENRNSDYIRAFKRVTDAYLKRITRPWLWLDFTFYLTSGRKVKKDIKLMHDFAMSIIQKKKEKRMNMSAENADNFKYERRKYLLDILLDHHIETNELTEEDIREEADTFIIAGVETTSLAMSWILYLLGHHKHILAKVHEELDTVFGEDGETPVTNEDLKELKYLECVIKETLRLYPPAPTLGRTAEKNKIISGYPIPDNATVVICPYMLHRNEDIFPNPEKFDPDRFTLENSKNRHPYAYIPFSAGPRNCIGQRYAMMEMKIVLSHLLRNYTVESIDPRDKVLPSIGLTLSSTPSIRIKIRSRHSVD